MSRRLLIRRRSQRGWLTFPLREGGCWTASSRRVRIQSFHASIASFSWTSHRDGAGPVWRGDAFDAAVACVGSRRSGHGIRRGAGRHGSAIRRHRAFASCSASRADAPWRSRLLQDTCVWVRLPLFAGGRGRRRAAWSPPGRVGKYAACSCRWVSRGSLRNARRPRRAARHVLTRPG